MLRTTLATQHLERLPDHPGGVDPLAPWIHQLSRHNIQDLFLQSFRLGMSLLLPDLHFPFLQNLLDNIIRAGLWAKSLLQVGCWGGLALGDGEEDVGDLEDVVEICFYAAAVFEDFVLVASDLEALLALFEADERNICQADLVGRLADVM